MLRRAEAGDFDLLIVPKLSRFGRSMRDNLEAYDRLEAVGVGIAFLDLRIDTSTSGGRLMRNMLTALAEYESDLISERWKDPKLYQARSGRPNTNPQLGYDYDVEGKTLRPTTSGALLVVEAFDRFCAGESARSIAHDFTRRVEPGLAGQPRRWTSSHILRIIDNPVYGGLRRHNGDLHPGNWEPLIPLETWERAQEIRRATKARTPAQRRQGVGKHLLSGLLHCEFGKGGAIPTYG